MTAIEYGIASPSRPGDIEPLGPVSRRTAEAVLADSRTVWTDVHLVQRGRGGDCTPGEECCEATCGCCPRVSAQDWCWLGSEQDDGSRYCSQHGEGWLLDRSPEAERKYQMLRDA